MAPRRQPNGLRHTGNGAMTMPFAESCAPSAPCRWFARQLFSVSPSREAASSRCGVGNSRLPRLPCRGRFTQTPMTFPSAVQHHVHDQAWSTTRRYDYEHVPIVGAVNEVCPMGFPGGMSFSFWEDKVRCDRPFLPTPV